MTFRVGDTFSAQVTTTDGRDITANIHADRVDRLGCGCHRIRARRPGPNLPDALTDVEFLTGVCDRHPNDLNNT